MLVRGLLTNSFSSLYLPALMCQSGENLKYLNILGVILIKSDDTEGRLVPAEATISGLHPHYLVR